MIKEKIEKYVNKLKQHQFLFEELVKRDFKKRYARTTIQTCIELNTYLRLIFGQYYFPWYCLQKFISRRI